MTTNKGGPGSSNARWALVTGASSGIGAACARLLAVDGWSLLLVGRSEARLAAAMRDAGPAQGEIRLIAADLNSPAACDAVVQAAAHHAVAAAILAAGFGTSGPFLAGNLADELDMIDVNCRAVAQMAHGVGQQMAARGSGTLVLLSSLVAFQGVARAANYAATKAYVQTLAEGLAAEWKPRGVAVLAVAPGPVNSGFAARAGLTMGATDTPETVARAIAAGLGRSGTIRPGVLSKLLGFSLGLLPRRARSGVMAQVMAGMTGAGDGR
jgi:short-subunit dehydrogenase